MSSDKRKLKFLVHSMEGTGHLNACIGFAQALANNGHECVFAMNESLQDHVKKYGFRVAVLEQNPKSDDNEGAESSVEENKFAYSDNPAKDMAASIAAMGIFENKTPLEKIASFNTNKAEAQFMENLMELMCKFNPQLERIIQQEKFDCFILDHFLFPPAFGKANLPWILAASAAPLTFYDTPCLPPPSSGYPSDDQSKWQEFRDLYSDCCAFYNKYQEILNERCNFKNENHYGKSGFFLKSPFLNVYQYPKELDYRDVYDVPSNIVGMDAFCRSETEQLELPESFQNAKKNNEKLIYLSMGSMGGFDIDLMQKILSILAKQSNLKVIVSKGPRGDEYELPANCWGSNFLPQPAVIDLVDLVITHGGNNSFTETFLAGKPMIVMPLFGDQYDNAQRVQEKGYGRRLEPYNFTEDQLVKHLNDLLNDRDLHERLQKAKQRIQTDKSKEKVAKLVEDMLLK